MKKTMASGLKSSYSSTSTTAAGGGGGAAVNTSGRFERQPHYGHGSSSSTSSSSGVSVRGGVGFGQTHHPVRPKAPSSRRSVTPNSRTNSSSDCEEGFSIFYLYVCVSIFVCVYMFRLMCRYCAAFDSFSHFVFLDFCRCFEQFIFLLNDVFK